MIDIVSSYRPHDPGHDYYAPGVYLITLVVRDRKNAPMLLGRLNDDVKSPGVCLSEVGKAVGDCWESIPERQKAHDRKVKVHASVCMPDHFHGVIEVVERMDVSLGEVICGFKIGCTQAWRRLQRPCTATETGRSQGEMPYMASVACSMTTSEKPDLHHMSKKKRAEYYASHPETLRPLWDDNYDDTICLSDLVTGEYCERHFLAMLRYVDDNPRRAIIRRTRPQFMQRCLHVRIGDRDYAAFGNLFLLRWARKVQVFCHRKARFSQLTEGERQRYGYSYNAAPELQTNVSYEETEAYIKECEHWEALVMRGATVIVTPGISRGESLMKDQCLDKEWPLIHLQKEPIGAFWKPEKRRFNACANGSLLILAPWQAESLGEYNGVVSSADYSMFHNLNTLAEEICHFNGEAKVLVR